MSPQLPPTPNASPSRHLHRPAAALALGLAAMLAAAGCGAATPTATAPAPIVDRAALQAELDALVDLGVPGVVVLVADGEQTEVMTAGVSDLDAGTPMGAADTFRIASVTKPFTATVVLQLVGEGVLSLDDTVQDWLPGIVRDADRITIGQLLHHTSGIADYFDDPAVLEPYLQGDYGHVWTPQQLVEIADQLGATGAPGGEWSYSNTNYAIVGLIVEAATGRPLGDEMRTRIFDPLDLEHTTFAIDATPDATLAHGYLMGAGDPIDVTGVFPFPFGAGNIVSDAADTATFYAALLGGEMLDAELEPPTGDDAVPYGLGLMAWTLPCGIALGHDGGFAGYSSRSLVLEDGRQVVILSNSITLDDHLAADPAADVQYGAIIDDAMCP
jgi:D-alanyl-D-alanine carboxypeptidase